MKHPSFVHVRAVGLGRTMGESSPAPVLGSHSYGAIVMLITTARVGGTNPRSEEPRDYCFRVHATAHNLQSEVVANTCRLYPGSNAREECTLSYTFRQ
jgi:hypothetical protein